VFSQIQQMLRCAQHDRFLLCGACWSLAVAYRPLPLGSCLLAIAFWLLLNQRWPAFGSRFPGLRMGGAAPHLPLPETVIVTVGFVMARRLSTNLAAIQTRHLELPLPLASERRCRLSHHRISPLCVHRFPPRLLNVHIRSRYCQQAYLGAVLRPGLAR
jgi:hypothetical protein